MVVRPDRLSRADLERGRTAIIRRGGWKAGLWATEVDGHTLLVKDVRHSNPIFRWCFGRGFLWHEYNMYGYMRDCEFVPKVIGRLDGDAFAIERVDAINLGRFKRPALTPEFYDRLQACVNRMHASGVVHLDLRSRRNILVTQDGQPMLVDFGNALFIGRSWLSRRILVPLLAIVDNSAIVKFRYRDFPDTLSRRQRANHFANKVWHVLWPWPAVWRAMGVNRWLKGASHAATSPRVGATTPSAVGVDARRETPQPALSDSVTQSRGNAS